MERKNLIWNINRICAWDCSICCTDAFHTFKKKDLVCVKVDGSTKELRFTRDNTLSLFDDANHNLQRMQLELSLEDKLRVFENLDIPVKIDFSGGDPLLLADNLKILQLAAAKFGKENISVTATGAGLGLTDPGFLKDNVSHIDFTYDFPENRVPSNRPTHYNFSNLQAVRKLVKRGIVSTAQTPLSKSNIDLETIEQIYCDLNAVGVDKVYLMKIFPVGRCVGLNVDLPSDEEYKDAISKYRSLEIQYRKPKVVVQFLLEETQHPNSSYKKRYAISNSLNITNLGLLLLSPWAYDKYGRPLNIFVAGDLKQHKLSELYHSNSYSLLLERLMSEKLNPEKQ